MSWSECMTTYLGVWYPVLINFSSYKVKIYYMTATFQVRFRSEFFLFLTLNIFWHGLYL